MSFEVPPGLGDLLRDFTIAVLRDRPAAERDLYGFAVEFFTKERDSRRATTDIKSEEPGKGDESERETPDVVVTECYSSSTSDNMSDWHERRPSEDRGGSESGDTYGEARIAPPIKFNPGRRKSIAGESFNPEKMHEDPVRVRHLKTEAQRAHLRKTVKDVFLFRSLHDEQIDDVIDTMAEHKAAAGDYVIKQGDAGDFFYVIDSGTYDVFMDAEGRTRKIRTMDKGSFGELALLYSQPRSADVVTVTPGRLWAMDGSSFRRIVVHGAFKRLESRRQFLSDVPLLANLDRWGILNAADELSFKTYKDGDVIIREGDPGDEMYIIEEGVVRVTVTHKGQHEECARLQKYDFFGELAVITNKARSASVHAVGHVKLLIIGREYLQDVEQECIDIMKGKFNSYTFSS